MEVQYENTPAGPREQGWAYAPHGIPKIVISIVTPFFNPGRVFAETAVSVGRQSWQDWEWIVVDDGSTDPESLGELHGIAAQDARVKILRCPENRGLSAARNLGLAEAKGRYVCWLDADDLLEPTFLEKCIWFLDTHQRVAFTKGYSIGFGAQEYLWKHGFHDRELFLKENRVDPTSLMRTEVARAIGGFDESIRGGLEDWDFWLRAAAAGYWGDTISEPLTWYRRRAHHAARWENLRSDANRESMEIRFRERYATLWDRGFPSTALPAGSKPGPTSSLTKLNQLEKIRRRVVLVIPHLEMGGADRFNLDLIAQLRNRYGWEVTVVTTRCSEDGWQGKFYELTSDLFMLHRFLPFDAYLNFLEYLLQSRQPDLIFLSHSEYGYCVLPWLKAAFPALPIVDLVHVVMEDWKNGGFPRLSCNAQGYLTRTIAVSEHLKQWLVANGANERSVSVVYCCTDTKIWTGPSDQARAARRRWGVPDSKKVILFAARFSQQKQPRLLLPIVIKLSASGHQFSLLLAGDGPERNWLDEHLCKRFPDTVRMLGPVDPTEMGSLMSACDLLLLPSETEGIALVLYEAMSLGVVPVATDVGGQRELVTSDCGILVPADAEVVDALARAVDKLLLDDGLRLQMSAAARARVKQHFQLDQMGSRMNAIFGECAKRPDDDLRSLLASDQFSAIALDDLAQLKEDTGAVDVWRQKLEEGKWLPRLFSRLADLLRASPARRLFRRVEIRYGSRIGSWVIRRS